MVSNFQHHARSNGSEITHSKEHALSEREFELLLEGAKQINGYQGTEAEFIVFAAGRLGLRASEIAHCRESWVDFREQIVHIPGHQECNKGKDGGMCGSCKQQVKQCAEHNGLDYDSIVENWWRPKTEAGIRGVPYDFSTRADLTIERFFDSFDKFSHSYTAIGRRVKNAAENAPELSKEDVYPHALRATAATYHVSRGLDSHPLTSLMGWANLSTAEAYISRSDQNTQRALRAVHSR